MIWSRLHGDMQGRRARVVRSTEATLSKTPSEIPCRVSNTCPLRERSRMQTGSYRWSPNDGESRARVIPREAAKKQPCNDSGIIPGWRSLANPPNLRVPQNAGVLDGEAVDTRWYLTGYVDGEGCFCLTFNRSKRHAFSWDIRPSFSVSQNSDRAEVLNLLQQVLGCGWTRPDRSDHTLKYEVRSVPDLVHKVIPHFERYPLLSGKAREFEAFAEICKRMLRREHLTRAGFQKIVDLAKRLNASSKKRYPRSEIKV